MVQLIRKMRLEDIYSLTSLADKELDKVLQSMDENHFTEDTLIVRVSDHGDMAMAHCM